MTRRKVLKTVGLTAKFFTLAVFFIVFLATIGCLYWFFFAKPYLDFPRPSGSDLYNALTYASFFRRYSTWPPSGWMHLWNEGTPVVGGYPWLFFYLIKPLYQFFDTVTAVQVFSLFFLGLFFIASFSLFLLVSGSFLLAFVFTLILLFTKASYFALLTSGFIAANAAQWLLPLTLIFLYRFSGTENRKYLVLTALTVGFSLLLHPPTTVFLMLSASLLMILLTSFGWKEKLAHLAFYLLLLIPISCLGLYTLYNQVISGQGKAGCNHPYCWGAYPEHFAWLNILLPFYLVIPLGLALLVKLFKRSLRLRSIFPFLLVFLVPVVYCVAAYFQLINAMAENFYPRRAFWAIALLALLVGASFLRAIREVIPKLSFLILLGLVLALGGFYYLSPQTFGLRAEHLMDYPAAYPIDAEKFVLQKYQREDFEGRIPEWLPYKENNYRFDTFNQEINVWWNLVSEMPITRGYSNHPLGRHRDWLYFLQTSVGHDQPLEANFEAMRHRAYFLFDAYGIGFHEVSGSMRLHPELVIDKKLVTKKYETHGPYLAFSQEVVTPIVSPTNRPAVLFVGDEEGYENFIRTAALANLNSRVMIPVKGPENFDKVKAADLNHFKTLILYRFQGKKWGKLEDFVKSGGNLFIESGSLPVVPKGKLPGIFPINQIVEDKKIDQNWNTEETHALRKLKVDQSLFSPLVFEGKPWTVVTSSPEDVRSWAQPVLVHEDKVIMAQGELGKGKVVWSGLNLLYHVVNKDNFEEAKLFGELVKDFVSPSNTSTPVFQVSRPRPEKIEVTASEITGVYFKENYHSGWEAKVNGKKIKLYQAGLDFMYFPVADSPVEAKVLISFQGSFLTWGLFILTVLTTFLGLFYLIASRPFHLLAAKIKQQLKNTRQWLIHIWERD